jgi:putative MATE family efflux protein
MHVTTRANERRMIAGIAIPVSLEFIVILVLNFVSQVIVGVLGATAIAAVGFANSLVFILIVTFGAMGVSVSILVARAFGGLRRSEMSHTITAALLIAGALTTLGLLVPLLAPGQLLTAVGASPSVAAAGEAYLRLSALSMLPIVLVSILSGALRSTGHARSPLIATLVTVPLNVLLAYALVLGVGPVPQLGVAGAGWAVLATSCVRLVILLAQAFVVHRTFDWSLPESIVQWRAIVTPLIVLALPLALTELLWSGGTFLYNVVAQQLGDDPLAAAQIVTTLEGVFMVGSIGLMSATTALVGRSVGQHDAPGAAHWVARLSRAGVVTGVTFGLLFALSAIAVPVLFSNAGSEVVTLAVVGILMNAAVQVVKVRNMILGAGVLPSGGDVKGVILGDGVSAFLVGLPLAILLGLFTPLGLIGIFVARIIEECAKLAIFTRRTRRIRWDSVVEREALNVA